MLKQPKVPLKDTFEIGRKSSSASILIKGYRATLYPPSHEILRALINAHKWTNTYIRTYTHAYYWKLQDGLGFNRVGWLSLSYRNTIKITAGGRSLLIPFSRSRLLNMFIFHRYILSLFHTRRVTPYISS